MYVLSVCRSVGPSVGELFCRSVAFVIFQKERF